MPHSRHERAVRQGLLRRQVDVLEAIAAAVDADVESLEQCPQCGEWFKQVSSHERHCDGP